MKLNVNSEICLLADLGNGNVLFRLHLVPHADLVCMMVSRAWYIRWLTEVACPTVLVKSTDTLLSEDTPSLGELV